MCGSGLGRSTIGVRYCLYQVRLQLLCHMHRESGKLLGERLQLAQEPRLKMKRGELDFSVVNYQPTQQQPAIQSRRSNVIVACLGCTYIWQLRCTLPTRGSACCPVICVVSITLTPACRGPRGQGPPSAVLCLRPCAHRHTPPPIGPPGPRSTAPRHPSSAAVC